MFYTISLIILLTINYLTFLIILDDLANALEHVKNILVMKMDPNTTQSQSELTAELDRTVKKSMGKHIAVIILLFIRPFFVRHMFLNLF